MAVPKTGPAKDPSPAPGLKAVPPATPASASATNDPGPTGAVSAAADEKASEVETATEASTTEITDSSASESAADPSTAEPAVSKERIILLAPLNPFIIEFHFTIDGQPHTQALERLVDDVLKLADTDADGRPTWKEVTTSKRFKYGQFGNLAINSDNDHKQIVERYDIDRDGLVDRTELPRFLTRNAGGSRSFSIRGTADYRDLNRRGAPTWQAIDFDSDGGLSAEERLAAAGRLRIRDTDDDEILLAADLNPRNVLPNAAMMTERRRRGPEAARLLGPHADWGNLRLALEHDYAGSSNLRPDSFPLTPQLFTLLDKNGDQRVERDEIQALNEVPPHVVIAVDFGRDGKPHAPREEGSSQDENEANVSQSETPTMPRLRLVSIPEELAVDGQSPVEQANRLTLRLGGMTLTIYTNDTAGADDFETRASQVLAMFDNNKNGYLEKDEVPEGVQAQVGPFEAVDADEDGKAFAGEIAAFLSQQQAALRSQIHAKASDREDALFAVLDEDHDERLDSRELEAAGNRLAALDRDSDGIVAPDDIPEAMVIGLARGSLENADALFTPPPVIVRGPAENAPRWFTAMDANADGAISPREFLGAPEQFAELDTDANALLELAEALQTKP